MNKTLKEWYEDNAPEASGIMRVVSQSFDNEPVAVSQEVPIEEPKEEDIKKTTDVMKPLFLASMIKVTLEELLKASNIDLTKEFKDDILNKVEKLKEEINKL